MGVPKFFRYMSERYPCLSEKLKEYQIPEFDNLYLDMNGIIHNCSHPNDADASFRISEETIFKNIFHYIEILFRIIRPQQLFFMAVDGVAPRAKINQQRGRRFRAAKEAEVLEAKARSKGQEIPKEARFDSNCITPGTLFMAKLNEQLRYFITYKVSTDKLWQKCKVILSGSEVPGEGEHKIMDYIRYMKAQPDYDGNTRHCLYGLDADLIMLGLCSHEPHFSLLREEVKFGKQQKKILTPEETNFCLLHLSLMREYLEHEFSPLKDKLPFQFDIERVIDDWVLMGFLVGNDFIPHLPNLHIENGALPILYNIYMSVLPTLDGYINETGILNLARFEKFMEKLSQFDLDQFDEIYLDLKYFEGKTGRKINGNGQTNNDSDQYVEVAQEVIYEFNDEKSDDSSIEDEVDDSDDDNMELEFVQHKRDYYMNKMEYKNVDAQVLRSQAEGYVRAIQWNLHYYYNGCCSWSWFYPHHYAPYISDIKDFKDLKIEFDLGEPFLPFQQLLAVLPTASKELLPNAYHNLLIGENSPIKDYYPIDFKTDLNGKRQEWEAVVLIPIIDEKSLLNAMKPYSEQLTLEEQKRNSHGPMCIFTYSKEDLGIYEAPAYFPALRNHAKLTKINREDILVPIEKLVKGLCKGVRLSVYYPGFPTLQHIPHTASLEKAKVKVFEQPSRRESIILSVIPQKSPVIDHVAKNLLGKPVFIGWPHLREALVISVSDAKKKISLVNNQMTDDNNVKFNEEVMEEKLIPYWNLQRKTIAENYKNRLGIDIGDIDILIHAKLMTGRQYVYTSHGRMTSEKQWNEVAMPFAYQVVINNISVHDPNHIQWTLITEVFKPKSICFMLGKPYYGALGEVVDQGVDLKTVRIKVALKIEEEPNLDSVYQLYNEAKLKYMPGNIAAQRLGISSHLLSRITGTIFIVNDKAGNEALNTNKENIGLNLKFNKKNEEVPGFTRKDSNGLWLYSAKSVDLVRNYMQKFPQVFERLEKNLLSSDLFLKSELFPNDSSNEIEAVTSWIKEQQNLLNITCRACGVEQLDSDIIHNMELKLEEYFNEDRLSKTVSMQVKPHLIYKPGLNSGCLPPDSKAYHRLFDRIVLVRESFTVPFGYKGTIIGIQKGENIMENMYEVLFDKPFPGGLVINGCTPNRAYRVSATDFINISYGIRIENKNKSTGSKIESSPNAWKQTTTNAANTITAWRHPNNPANSPSPWRNSPDASNLKKFFGEPFSKSNHNHQQYPRCPKNYAEQQMHNSNPKGSLQMVPDFTSQRKQKSAVILNSNQLRLQQFQKRDQSEYETIWNELGKMQIPQQESKSSVHNLKGPVSNQESTSALKEVPQDPSTFLKAILKISDTPESNKQATISTAVPNSVPFKSVAKSSDSECTPLVVQQLFDKARQAEMSGKGVWYSSQLISHYQKIGIGYPRYHYLPNKDNKVCAQIILPDTRTFHGEFCDSHGEAAENVAKKAYEELKLNQFVYGPGPSQLNYPCGPPPPQQWYKMNQNAMHLQSNPTKPMLPSAFPSAPMPPMPPMPKWTPINQQGNSNHFLAMTSPNQHVNNQAMHQSPRYQQFPRSQDNNRQGYKSDNNVKKQTPFVPLQAQKKSRNVASKLNDSENLQQTSNLPTRKIEQKSKVSSPKELRKESIKKEDSNNQSTSQKTQKSTVQQSVNRQRRSRLAAKFQTDPMTNGGKK